ncbi:MAG: dephospho-CoA kinase [Chlamydiae bacterium]|nr:dephospho-CoA kinase [Chlamydiota bacterium]
MGIPSKCTFGCRYFYWKKLGRLLRLKKIAVTGGLSSGKSTVCGIFKDLGAYTVSSDEIVHNLFLNDRPLQRKIIDLLGSDIVVNNLLDRKKISNKVFSQPLKLQALERLIHPAVFNEIQTRYLQVCDNKEYAFFVAEVPLLFETDSQHLFDYVITVLSSEKKCKERFKIMTGQSESQFQERMIRQINPKQKAEKADFMLINNGSLDELYTQVVQLSSKLRSQ